MKKVFPAILFVLGMISVSYAHEMVWNKENKFDAWKSAENVLLSRENGNLVLKNIGKDPQIVSDVLQIDPSKYNRLSIRYKAVGVSRNRGELYYAHDGERFSDRRRWLLEPLIADGEWHTMVLDRKKLTNPGSFFEGGIITKLRIDPVNGPGGTVEISEIKFFTPANEVAKEIPEWNKENNFIGWQAASGVQCSVKNGVFAVKILKKDPQIISGPLKFDPEPYSKLTIRYRATGTGPAKGEMYYAHDGGNFSDNKKWIIPTLNNDGQWHTMVLTEKNMFRPTTWTQGANITRLRFDPTNSGTGSIEISEIKFTADAAASAAKKKSSAVTARPLPEIKIALDASKWNTLEPSYLTYGSENLPRGAYFTGKMIKSVDDKRSGNKNPVFYLRNEIFLKSKPVQAWLQYVADDRATAYVNGTNVAFAANWRLTETAEVTSELSAGKNVWGFSYQNSYSAGGVMAELYVRYADGSCERFVTDKKFKTFQNVPGGWCRVGFDDSAWKNVIEQNGPPVKPWVVKVAYKDFHTAQHLRSASVVPQEATAGETVRLTFNFLGDIPKNIEADIILYNKGKVLWKEAVEITEKDITAGKNGRWTLRKDYKLPLYLNSNDITCRLVSSALFCKSGGLPQVSLRLNAISHDPAFSKNTVADVAENEYGPHVVINGKPTYIFWGATSVKQHPKLSARHSGGPLNAVTVWSVTDGDSYWPRCGEFNTSVFDSRAEKFRREHPDAWFIMDLSLYPPHDWQDKNPDQMCLDEDGRVNKDGWWINYSFSSAKALKDIEEAMVRAITYLENSPYANRIIGYRINSGHTIEWLGWDPRKGKSLDFSEISKAAFKKFAKEKYGIANAQVPTFAQRSDIADGELLWEPAEHLNVTAFHDFYSDQMANFLIHLCSKAKKLVKNRKLIGTYYGYGATLHGSGDSQLRAHYALKRVLDSQAVDFLLSPPAYSIRNHGDTLGDMKPFASIRHRGVVSLLEDDTRTHHGVCLGRASEFQSLNEENTINIIRRNLGIALCRNMPSYLYAIANATDYDFPAMDRLIAQVRTTGEFCLKKQTPRKAEIAVVYSEKSIHSQPVTNMVDWTEITQQYHPDGKVQTYRNGGRSFNRAAFITNASRFAGIGAGVDFLLAENMVKEAGNYKLYIFLNCFTFDDEFLRAVEKLRQKECVMLWLYAPGYTRNMKNSVANMKTLTGMDLALSDKPLLPAAKLADGRWLGTGTRRVYPNFYVADPEAKVLGVNEDGKPGIAAVKTGKALSIFSCAYLMDVPFLKDIAEKANVFCFSQTPDPAEANASLITLHARYAGEKHIKLPHKSDVIDVYNKKLIGKGIKEFKFDAPLHSSWLFYYGDDAEKLLAKLNGKGDSK